ncbi:MAG: tyrosine-type recombinase/integrase [Thermoproteota archaeon]
MPLSYEDPDKLLSVARNRVERDVDISKHNKQLILSFLDFLLSDNVHAQRIHKYAYTLVKLAKLLNKPFDKAGELDIQQLVKKIMTSGFSEWTKHDYKAVLKRFYGWLNKNGKTRLDLSWVKLTMKRNQTKLPEEVLTIEEVERLVNAALNYRDRALIMALYESGARAGEFLPLKIRHLEFNEIGCKITLHGKTGSRKIPLVHSTHLIKAWLEKHPDKDNPEAYLWCGLGYANKGEMLSHQALKKILVECASRAGVKKKVYPHLFRHSRATELAKKMTEAEMCHFFGWTLASKMPAVYVHLSGRDLDKAVLKASGLKITEEMENAENLVVCQFCKKVYAGDVDFCKTCGRPLKEEAMELLASKEIGLLKIFSNLLMNKQFRRMLVKSIRKAGLEKELKSVVE